MNNNSNDFIIQLGKVTYKEAKEKLCPKSILHISGNPELDSIPIYMSNISLRRIISHARSNMKLELGGIMLGELCREDNRYFLEIIDAIPADHVEHSSTHIKFTHKTWEKITYKWQQISPDLSIVGWYHTHPGMGVFLSSYDIFIQKNFFNEIWQVALVIDPVQEEYKFFRLIEDKIVACNGFYYLRNEEEKVEKV